MNYIEESNAVGIECFEHVSIERQFSYPKPKPTLIQIVREGILPYKDFNKEYDFKYKGMKIEIRPMYQLITKGSTRKRFSSDLKLLIAYMENGERIIEHRIAKVYKKKLFSNKVFITSMIMEKKNYYELEADIKDVLDKHVILK